MDAAKERNRKARSRPSTPGKKAREGTQNALKHGLTTVRLNNPIYSAEIEELAHALCDGDSNPDLFDTALQLAAAQMMLREIRRHGQFLINRLRDPQNLRTTSKRAYGRELRRRWRRQCDLFDKSMPKPAPDGPFERSADYYKMINEILYVPPQRRPEAALLIAVPELVRVARYERDAWRIWNRAFSRFVAVKAADQTGVFVRTGQ